MPLPRVLIPVLALFALTGASSASAAGGTGGTGAPTNTATSTSTSQTPSTDQPGATGGVGVALAPAPPSTPQHPTVPGTVAKIIKAVAEEEDPGLIITGKQAIDDDCNQVGQMVAALMGRPQGAFANKIKVEDETVVVKREIDGGVETLRLSVPAVVTADLRLNEPRYASLSNIMKAKSKPLATRAPADFGVDIAPRLKTLRVSEPPVRAAGVKVADVDAVIAKLKELGVA